MGNIAVLIDSHCHIDFPEFDEDRMEVIDKCTALGINTIVVPGTMASKWQSQIHLASQFPQLRFALGLHPYFLASFIPEHIVELRNKLQEYRRHVVALGEIGLDSVIKVDWQLQVSLFKQQIELAQELSLPVILHHRKSHNETIQILKRLGFKFGGIVHGFSGSLQQASTYIDLGFKIGVGGTITYPRAIKTRQAISQLPLSSLVLETDSPDMPIKGRQGRRNSPEYLIEIVNCLLSLRNESKEELMAACYKNVREGLTNI